MILDPLLKRGLVTFLAVIGVIEATWYLLLLLHVLAPGYLTPGLLHTCVLLATFAGPLVKRLNDSLRAKRTRRIRRSEAPRTARIVKRVIDGASVKLTLAVLLDRGAEEADVEMMIEPPARFGGTAPGFLVDLYVDEKDPTVLLVEPTGEWAPSDAYRAVPPHDDHPADRKFARCPATLGRRVDHRGWLSRALW